MECQNKRVYHVRNVVLSKSEDRKLVRRIYIGGPGGSGKTTALQAALNCKNCVAVDLDTIGYHDDDGKWIIPTEIHHTLTMCKPQKLVLAAGADSRMPLHFGAAAAAGCELVAIIPDPETLAAQLRKRQHSAKDLRNAEKSVVRCQEWSARVAAFNAAHPTTPITVYANTWEFWNWLFAEVDLELKEADLSRFPGRELFAYLGSDEDDSFVIDDNSDDDDYSY